MNAQTKVETPAVGIHGALARAQAALSAPSKNREVEVKLRDDKGKYKFKYATLDHLIEHVRKPLTDNGLWFFQRTDPGVMVTVLTHESGETIESAIPMPNLPAKPQEAGSVLTYFRRYSLSIALGLASDEDDDANVAEGNGYEPRNQAKSFPPGPARNITQMKALSRELWSEIEGCGDSGELEPLLEMEEHRKLMKQMSLLEGGHAELWFGDGKDNPGLQGLIRRKRQEFGKPTILQAG